MTYTVSPAAIVPGMIVHDDNGAAFARVVKVAKRGKGCRVETVSLDGRPYLPISFPAGTTATVS